MKTSTLVSARFIWLVLVISPSVATIARAQAEHGAPSNLELEPSLAAYVERMWQSSQTFRGQCSRLGAAPDVRVRFVARDPLRPAEHRARSVMTRSADSRLTVSVYVPVPSVHLAELIAHEIEHVLEQVDGVNLEQMLRTKTAWRVGPNAFETRRARDIGRRVQREVWQAPRKRGES